MRSRSMAMVMAVLVAACATSEPVPEPPKPAPVEARPEPSPQPATPAPAPVAPAPVVKAEPPPAPKPAPARVYPTQRPGEAQHTILVGKLKRTYVLHVPRGYEPTASVPLVVFLHARGSSTQTARNYGFSAKADAERFAVAYPEALGQPRVWNAIHDHGRSNADDTAFVLAMIDEIATTLNIDPRRIYLVGYSSGGMMAYRLAATTTSRFAARSRAFRSRRSRSR